MKNEKDCYPYLSEYWDELESEITEIRLVEIISKIIDKEC